ncbi:hypothetical protein CKO45_27635, partial [Paracraurococcus ruber]|nr:hypothetical protein [Paracraurococcus ruber]
MRPLILAAIAAGLLSGLPGPGTPPAAAQPRCDCQPQPACFARCPGAPMPAARSSILGLAGSSPGFAMEALTTEEAERNAGPAPPAAAPAPAPARPEGEGKR